jgi:hypothetical protein
LAGLGAIRILNVAERPSKMPAPFSSANHAAIARKRDQNNRMYGKDVIAA